MALADVLKTWMRTITAGDLSESILYRSSPSKVFSTISAFVRRQPVDIAGNVLENRVEIWISKTDLVKVRLGEDEVRLPADKVAGEPPRTYRVQEIIGQDPGRWHLSCAD